MDCRRKICVLTYGCPENRIDGARIQEFFKRNNYTLTDEFCDADVIFLNACGLTGNSDKHGRKVISRIKAQKKPSAQLIVGGCLTRINKDLYQGLTFGLDDDLEQLNTDFEAETRIQDVHANFLLPQARIPDPDAEKAANTRSRWRKMASPKTLARKLLSYPRKTCGPFDSHNGERTIAKLSAERQKAIGTTINLYDSSTFLIKVSTGCLNACTYCGVRLSRGKLKSKPINDVAREFKEGLGKGYKQFGLIGTDVGAYGRDRGTDLVGLLAELFKNSGDYKIKLRNIQPRFLSEMMPELREILQSGKIPYLGSAAESGNNRILSLMNRRYKIEDFKKAISLLNRDFPQINLRTQLMVGFPSETEKEFQDTVRLLDELNFDVVESYIFQPRPGTKAAKMDGQIPQEVGIRRCYELCMKSEKVIPYL